MMLGFPASRIEGFHSDDLRKANVEKVLEAAGTRILRRDRRRILWKPRNPVDTVADVKPLMGLLSGLRDLIFWTCNSDLKQREDKSLR